MPWMKCLDCGGGGSAGRRDNNKLLSVSQPIHLLVKNEHEPQCHVYRVKRLRKPRPCQMCHQPMVKQASTCRVCKFTCHKACEDKNARFKDTSQQIHKQWQTSPSKAFPIIGNVPTVNGTSGNANSATSNGTAGGTNTTNNNNNSGTNKNNSTTGDTQSLNSTPSPSPSPNTALLHNGGSGSSDGPQPKNSSNSNTPSKQVLLVPLQTHKQRTPGVGADEAGKDEIDTTSVMQANGGGGAGGSIGSGGGGGGRITEVMELCYVTERIIALWYREDTRGVFEHATSLLKSKHANNYLIFNLSPNKRPGEPNLRDVGWPQGLAPTLEKLCTLCKEVDSWLNAAPHRVIVLHTRGSKERLGVAVSAYMNYSSICGGRDQALDRFAMRRFLDDKIGLLHVPSYIRYIEYFSGLLAGSLQISPSPLYLTHLTVFGVPLFESKTCTAFFKVYEGLTPVYTSDLYSVSSSREFTVSLGPGLRLRGDILVKCYHRVYSNQGREVMFSLQFHTCVVTDNVISFSRSELDVACKDPRFPPNSQVTLYFAGEGFPTDSGAPSPTVPHASSHHDPVLHWDSYTNLELSDDEERELSLSPAPVSSSSAQVSPRGLNYTCGPIDGSLYAVVHQPQASHHHHHHHHHHQNHHPHHHNHHPDHRGGHHQHQQQQHHQQQHQHQHSTGRSTNSPLTVSMDSGISSAPPQRFSPPDDSQIHNDLDKLLQDMMMTVESIPDHTSDAYNGRSILRNGSSTPSKMYIHEQPHHYQQHHPSSSAYSTLKDSSSRGYKESSPPYSSCSTLKNQRRSNSPFSPSVNNINYIDEDIPYHARQTSQPFSYGATPEMIKHQKLSSPSLVRKASFSKPAPIADLDEILEESPPPVPKRPMSPAISRTPPSPPVHQPQYQPQYQPQQQQPQQQQHVIVERASTPEPPIRSMNNDGVDGGSWLKQQQMKLAQRRDEQSPARIWRQERGNRLIGELKNVQKSRLRNEGYQSDSAVHNEDDDEEFWTFKSEKTMPRAISNASAPASPMLIPRSNYGGRRVNGDGYVVNHSTPIRSESLNERSYAPPHHTPSQRNHDFHTRSHNDSISSSWTERSASPASVQTMSMSSRPQTPAFPVHPRTPYGNSVSPAADRTDFYHREPQMVSYANNNNNNNSHAEPYNHHNNVNHGHHHREQRHEYGNGHSNNNNNNGYVERYVKEREEIKEVRLPPKSPTMIRKERPVSPLDELISYNSYSQSPSTPSYFDYGQGPKSSDRKGATAARETALNAVSYSSIHTPSHSSAQVHLYGSRASSIHSNTEPQEVADANVKFVRDTSRIWYKPNISREQAINMLRDAVPGTFVVRDSNSFPGAFGLALKVATPPPGAPISPRDPSSELVRHFLIEPTSRGVRLKGCANEPVFSSLSALVYQHSLTAMALPCTLLLPEPEAAARVLESVMAANGPQQLLAQGAACNVLYLFTLDTESLTGPQAIKKTITVMFQQRPRPIETVVHFKVSALGITLTDNARKLFFRRHYPTNNISYSGMDTEERTWQFFNSEKRCFGFVARKPAHKSDNQCHIFAELESEQPATAIINFINKVMKCSAHSKANIV